MRLIDADALKNAFSNMYREDYERWIKEVIDNAPTIEPFEKIGAICNENCGGYRPTGEWIPVTSRPMTREEYEENAYVGDYDIPFEEARVFTCPLPDDGQEILISHGGFVDKDVVSWDDGYIALENYEYFEEISAWMPLPEPYTKGGDGR